MKKKQKSWAYAIALWVPLTAFVGCGGGGGSGAGSPLPVTVTVSSPQASVLLGNTQQFTATVANTANTAVVWSVNGTSGGNGTVGTISTAGLYTAPNVLPTPATVTITATSQSDTSATGSAALAIVSDITVAIATSPAGLTSIDTDDVIPLTATVASAGHPDTMVSWTVNGVPNGNSTVGTITTTGVTTAEYTAPSAAPPSNPVSIVAQCSADPSKSATLVATIQTCSLTGTIGYVAPAAYVPPPGATCNVSDLTTLASCVAAVRSGTIANIQFTAMLNCSGNDTCLVDLSNVQGPVTLFGAPGSSTGFERTDTYTYPILNISQASNITVANLTFNEGPADTACTPYEANGAYTYPCESTIIVDNSTNIVLEQVSVLHSKDHGAAVSASQDVTIQDSTIQDSGVFGIWSGGSQSSNVSITNNLIQDSQSNGIYLSFTQGTVIQRNTLQHNHRVALFDECGGLCPGGQIDMLDNTSLQINSNLIINGQIDLNNATGQTDGIEIDDSNAGVTITNNSISNNLGAGILADPGTTATNFQITGNKLYDNGTNFYGLAGTGIQESGDCVSH
jgi:parallel beta-helix repeat protein